MSKKHTEPEALMEPDAEKPVEIAAPSKKVSISAFFVLRKIPERRWAGMKAFAAAQPSYKPQMTEAEWDNLFANY